MTIKPSSTNEALIPESEPKVDLVTTQTSAADYNMRKRQITQNTGDGERYTTM
jgi:hypothetical protein